MAIKRRRIYLAGFLIALTGALYGTLKDRLFSTGQHIESPLVPILAVSLYGIAAVWFLLFVERLNTKLKRENGESKPTFGKRALVVVLGLFMLEAIS